MEILLWKRILKEEIKRFIYISWNDAKLPEIAQKSLKFWTWWDHKWTAKVWRKSDTKRNETPSKSITAHQKIPNDLTITTISIFKEGKKKHRQRLSRNYSKKWLEVFTKLSGNPVHHWSNFYQQIMEKSIECNKPIHFCFVDTT